MQTSKFDAGKSDAGKSDAGLDAEQLRGRLTRFRRDKLQELALTSAGFALIAGIFLWLLIASPVIEIRTLIVTFLTGLCLTALQFYRRVVPSLALSAEPVVANAVALRAELARAAEFARGGFVLEFLPIAPALAGNLALIVLSMRWRAPMRFDWGPALVFAVLILLSTIAVLMNMRSTTRGLKTDIAALDAMIASARPA